MKQILIRWLLEPFTMSGMNTSATNAFRGWFSACGDTSFRRLLVLGVMHFLLMSFLILTEQISAPSLEVCQKLFELFFMATCFELFNVAIEFVVDVHTGNVINPDDSGLKEVRVHKRSWTRLGRDAKDIAGLPTMLMAGYAFLNVWWTIAVHWI